MRSASRRNAFVAIADPTRREILELLRDRGPLMAGEVASNFGEVSRPGISRHLRVLKECGVVSAERAGTARHYSLCPEPLMEIRNGWLADFSANHNKSLARLRKRVETNKKT